ncbi:MAG: glycosyltransferase family 39 protein [Candidatus Altiarchaeota archaeon]
MDVGELWDKRKDTIVPVLVFILAFSLRFYFRGAGLFHTDSVIEAFRVEASVREGTLYYMHHPGYPGQVVLTSFFFIVDKLLTGAASAEFAATFASILFGALGVVAIYFLAREVTGSFEAAIFSAVILTFLPVHFSITTYAKNHGASSFLFLSSMYFAFRGVNTKSVKLKVLSSLLLGFSITVRLSNVLFIPILALVFWKGSFPVKIEGKDELMRVRLNDVKKTFTDIAIVFAPLIIVLLVLYAKMIMTDGFYPIFYAGMEDSKFMGFFTNLLKMSLEWFMFSMTWPGLILAVIGTFLLYKKRPYETAILTIWALVCIFYLGNLRTISPRFMIPGFIPFIILAGFAVSTLYDKKGAASILAVVILLIVAGNMFVKIQPVVAYRHEHCGPCEVGKYVKEKTPPNSVIIVMDQSYHIRYYGNRTTTSHSNWAQDLEGDMRKYHGILTDGRPLYIVSDGLGYDTADGAFRNRLMAEFQVTEIGTIEDDDWHRDTIFLQLHKSSLYRLTEKR